MCTATLLPLDPSGFRLVTNRDEQHTRAPAVPPQVRRFGTRRALLPIDPLSDGTWVVVNDAGLAITLLNLNPSPAGGGGGRSPSEGERESEARGRAFDPRQCPHPNPLPEGEGAGGKQSRGGVIPSLMHHATAADAASQAGQLDAATMMPFRLLIADGQAAYVVRSDGGAVTVNPILPAGRPAMLTSSGLGDHLVETPRRELFHARDFLTPADQDAFHRHRWPDRSELSIAMHRDDARTVSRTVVEVSTESVTMSYTPIDFSGREGELFFSSLSRSAKVSA